MSAAGVRIGVGGADRDADVEPGTLGGQQLERGRRRDDDDGHRLALVDLQPTRRQLAAVQEHRSGPRPRGCGHGVGRSAADRCQHGPPGDEAETLRVEEVDARRSGARDRQQRERMPRRDRADERQPPVEDDIETLVHDHPHERLGAQRVRRADGQRRCPARRAGNRAERGTRRAVVACRCDQQRAEVEGALGRPRLWAFGESRVRLDDAGHCDPHGVVRVTVAIRVDGALEPGEQLIAARVHQLAAVGRGLPAGDADRQDGRSGRDAVQAVRAVDAGDDPRHLGAVALELGRVLRVGAGTRVEAAADDVVARQQPSAQVGMRQIDARVEQTRP